MTMKSTRAFFMILVSAVVAAMAVYLASRWVTEQTALATNRIAVAATDIQLASPITAEMVKLADWPAGSMPPGAFSDAKALETRVVKTSILRGEPILESKLAPEGTKGGLSAVIDNGMRAITVRVNDVIGVAGFALPGNYVDVVVNTQEEGGTGGNKDRSISKIVLEHILVLAVAQEASRDETKPKVVNAVTLQVTPEQAEKLDLARSVGTLSLVLRSQVDPKPAETKGATKETLLQLRKPEPAKAQLVTKRVPLRVAVAPPPQNCVDVITGVQRSRECF
jgi:pilus assembly protein CpaB